MTRSTDIQEQRGADMRVEDWVRSQVESEPYWFHRIELPNGVVTPGWSNPTVDKLPYFGLPDDMTGMRVLDIGHAEGFFCFEAERRGAAGSHRRRELRAHDPRSSTSVASPLARRPSRFAPASTTSIRGRSARSTSSSSSACSITSGTRFWRCRRFTTCAGAPS